MKPLYKKDPVIKGGILHPGNGKVYEKSTGLLCRG